MEREASLRCAKETSYRDHESDVLYDRSQSYDERDDESLGISDYFLTGSGRYMRDILAKQIEFLDQETLDAYIYRAKQGDLDARNTVMETHLPLIVSIAKKYVREGIELEDLINEGVLGMVQAINDFDQSRGVKFITYCKWPIRGAIVSAAAVKSRGYRLPDRVAYRIDNINRVREYLSAELFREPTDAEVADEMKITKEHVEYALSCNYTLHSYENFTGETGEERSNSFEEIIGSDWQSPFDYAYQRDLSDHVNLSLSKLTERQKEILICKYGLEGSGVFRSNKEVASIIGGIGACAVFESVKKSKQSLMNSRLKKYIEEDDTVN